MLIKAAINAIDTNELEELSSLLTAYPFIVNEDAENHRSLLHIATLENNVDAVEELLRHGARTDIHDTKLGFPLVLAATFGFADIISLFISNGANVNIEDLDSKLTAVHMATYSDYKDIITTLFRAGADLNWRGQANAHT